MNRERLAAAAPEWIQIEFPAQTQLDMLAMWVEAIMDASGSSQRPRHPRNCKAPNENSDIKKRWRCTSYRYGHQHVACSDRSGPRGFNAAPSTWPTFPDRSSRQPAHREEPGRTRRVYRRQATERWRDHRRSAIEPARQSRDHSHKCRSERRLISMVRDHRHRREPDATL